MTTQLIITNGALGFLGERSLLTTGDATEAARTMAAFYTPAVKYCLEQGHWKFAERRAVLTPSLTELPAYGRANAFAHPSDYVRVNSLCSDERFSMSVTDIEDVGAFWYCDLDTLYLKYVSNDGDYGLDLDLWPETFVLFVQLYLAALAAPRLAPKMKIEAIQAPGGVGLIDAKRNALAKDAVSGPTQFLPTGRWVGMRSRNRNNRTSSTSLYGS